MSSSEDDDARTTMTTGSAFQSRGLGGLRLEKLTEIGPAHYAGGCGCCLILVTLLLASLKGLHATKFAITQNSFTGVVHFDPVYYGGRNLVGFWNHYIEFPATVQSIEWLHGSPSFGSRDLSPFHVRTLDGLMVNLGIVAKYHIRQDKIPEIYRLYKDGIEEFFVSNLRSELQQTIANFPATALYQRRGQVDAALERACEKVCREHIHDYIACWYINLLDVELAAQIEAMNIREQVEKQKQRTELMRRNATLIRTDMEVLSADFDRQQVVVEARAAAAAYNITNEAEADAQAMWNKAGGESLDAIQEEMGSTAMRLSNYQLLDYLEKVAIIEEPRGPMLYGDFQAVSASMHVNDLEL